MDNERELLNHVIDIKERMSSLETQNETIIAYMQMNTSNVNQLKDRVNVVEKEQEAGKARLTLVQWIAGILVSIGGITIALMKTSK